MNIQQFKQLPLMGILRGISADAVTPLSDVIVSSGLKTIEVTMNTPQALTIIKAFIDATDNQVTVGAGTVLSVDDARSAVGAGAQFIVSPTLEHAVVEYCKKNTIPVFPGALSPQEIYTAWNAGASMVKIFPARLFGPGYFNDIHGPFNDIALLACGGVTEHNMHEYFLNGASAIAFGASVFRHELIRAEKYAQIEKNITALINAYVRYKNSI